MNKKVAIITSGGDASGVNAAIYSLLLSELDVIGFHGGYEGIVNSNPINLSKKDFRMWRTKGELYIKSGRSELPITIQGRQQIKASLLKENVDVLVVFGGDGSAKGARYLQDLGVDIVHIPMTIDNDIFGTEYTIGHKTALEQIHTQISNLHQTGANLPGRIFIVETFGGLSGQLTLLAGIVSGAHLVLLPEYEFSIKDLIYDIDKLQQQGEESIIILCSEAAYQPSEYHAGDQGIVSKISKEIESSLGVRVRQTILGYTQRSGDPNVEDVLQSTRMGAYAAQEILKGKANYMVGIKSGQLVSVRLEDVISHKGSLVSDWVKLGYSHQILIGKER